ncbi:hypothetical protein [Lewinella sp. IMCC34191]|uniref:hypothetical protein n=1 Tax=Lewinella sp. IMCC34191 TaxID=2259172 RepID=UPI000E2504B8|nr:hypothetical protein [Lewinella sp. IMCC34191]
MTEESQPFTATDFGDDFQDFDPELREQAIEIANQLRQERPEESRGKIAGLALQRACVWWMDRAG